MGGLGNQLFQVNYGYRLMEMGLSVQFVDNLCKKSFLTERILSWKIHPYMLDGVVKVATHTESNIAPVFFSKINMLNQWSNYIDCQPIPNLPKNIFGYFQCKELQDQVFFNNNIQPLLLGLSKSRAKIVAHLRFGDAPNLEQNMKYYVRALNELGRSRFCVCTDDKKFAQKFLKDNHFDNYFFSEGDLMDDFRVILSATVVIAAPSTFSFWAIKLSKTISEIYLPVEIYRALGSPSNFAKTHVV